MDGWSRIQLGDFEMNTACVVIPTISSLIFRLSKKSDDSLSTEQGENVSVKCLDPRGETLNRSSCPHPS